MTEWSIARHTPAEVAEWLEQIAVGTSADVGRHRARLQVLDSRNALTALAVQRVNAAIADLAARTTAEATTGELEHIMAAQNWRRA